MKDIDCMTALYNTDLFVAQKQSLLLTCSENFHII